MKIKTTTTKEHEVEIQTPAYFTDGSTVCPSFYKLTENGAIEITKFSSGQFTLVYPMTLDKILTYDKITAEKFYEIAEEFARYLEKI